MGVSILLLTGMILQVPADSLDFSSFGAFLLSSLARESSDHFCALVSLNSSHRCNYFWKSPVGLVSLLEAFLSMMRKNVGFWSLSEVGDVFFVERFLVTWLEKFLGGMSICKLHLPAFFSATFWEPPEKKILSWRHLSHPQDLFFLYHSWGGSVDDVCKFLLGKCTTHSTHNVPNFGTIHCFFVRTTMVIGSCFYALFFCLLEFLRSKGFIVKHRIVQPGGWLIKNHKYWLNTEKNHNISEEYPPPPAYTTQLKGCFNTPLVNTPNQQPLPKG